MAAVNGTVSEKQCRLSETGWVQAGSCSFDEDHPGAFNPNIE